MRLLSRVIADAGRGVDVGRNELGGIRGEPELEARLRGARRRHAGDGQGRDFREEREGTRRRPGVEADRNADRAGDVVRQGVDEKLAEDVV